MKKTVKIKMHLDDKSFIKETLEHCLIEAKVQLAVTLEKLKYYNSLSPMERKREPVEELIEDFIIGFEMDAKKFENQQIWLEGVLDRYFH